MVLEIFDLLSKKTVIATTGLLLLAGYFAAKKYCPCYMSEQIVEDDIDNDIDNDNDNDNDNDSVFELKEVDNHEYGEF